MEWEEGGLDEEGYWPAVLWEQVAICLNYAMSNSTGTVEDPGVVPHAPAVIMAPRTSPPADGDAAGGFP